MTYRRNMVQRIVIHADDVGMCHGANTAFVELSHRGTITAGSVMVPCPWFSEIAAMARDDERLDVGVHLTLTSEHPHYRWGPVSAPPASAGLVGDDGFLHASVAAVRERAEPDAVEVEWRAQIDRALAAGIDMTHLDAHMGAATAPEFAERYVALGVEYDVPVLMTPTVDDYGPNNHLRGTTAEGWSRGAEAARTAGMPLFGTVLETDFGRARDEPVDYPTLLGSTDSELVFCAFHPCRPGPGEVEVIEPDAHHARTDEYDLFRTDAWTDWLADQSFEPIGMRELRDEWRTGR